MLITFEGIDGCGKSTQLKNTANYLKDKRKDFIALREPGGTALSESIRELLLHSDDSIGPRCEILLFEAARAHLTEKIIKPALDQGRIVLCDRFYDSTLAYQGYGRGLNKGQVKLLNEFASYNIRPDITFYLDISYETAIERTNSRKPDRIENNGREFYFRIIDGFRSIADSEPERVILISGERPAVEVFSDVKSQLSKMNI
ncbi:MAG: dTMP kinase [Candidatus Kapaibacterium sp.]